MTKIFICYRWEHNAEQHWGLFSQHNKSFSHSINEHNCQFSNRYFPSFLIWETEISRISKCITEVDYKVDLIVVMEKSKAEKFRELLEEVTIKEILNRAFEILKQDHFVGPVLISQEIKGNESEDMSIDIDDLEAMADSVVKNLLNTNRKEKNSVCLEALGEEVKAKRLELGLSREDLAVKINKEVGYIILLEAGLLSTNDVDESIILNLSKVLDLDRFILEILASQEKGGINRASRLIENTIATETEPIFKLNYGDSSVALYAEDSSAVIEV